MSVQNGSRMKSGARALLDTLDRVVWRTPHESLGVAGSALVRLTRMAIVLGRDLAQGQLTLRAMSLVYTTLLSIVPLLALSFSVLKAFGVYNQIQPMLLGFLEPLGEKGVELTGRIIQFIENINVGVLGSLGLALLLYTAVSLVQKIEESFNFIWHVRRMRGIGERFSRYLSALLVGPVLVFSALGITAAAATVPVVREAMEVEAIGWVALQIGRLVPYLLVIGAFTFVYLFIPNTRVRIGPAFVGGIVGGALWQTAGWAFALFVATSTKYAAIYSGFAILVLFMIWLYLSWLILLFGAAVAFYVQHPEYRVPAGGEPRLSNRMRERLSLVVLAQIAERHAAGGPAWTAEGLAQLLRVPMLGLEAVLGALMKGGVLARTAGDPPGYLPARDLDGISVKEALDIVRSAGESRYFGTDSLPVPPQVGQLIERWDAAAEAALRDVPLKSLADASSAGTANDNQG